MKNIRPLALLLLISIATISNGQKIAHINFDSLVTATPEAKTVKEVSEKFMIELKTTMADMEKEFQSKYSDYMTNKDKLSDLAKKTKEEDLQSLQTRIQEYNQQAEFEYQKKMSELTAPIIEKAKKAVEAAAKESGYKYVFDLSGNIIYAEASDDIFAASKKKLDTMPLVNIPGSKQSTPKANPK
jgi:outer membrane protein